MNMAVREALWFHLIFFLVAAPVLMFAKDASLGQGVLLLTLGYNIALPALALVRGHAEWLTLWSFLLPISAAQVLPDLALVKVAGVLLFPDLGQYRIGGEVPIYFMGMWMMLLFPILLLSNGSRSRYLKATVMALAFFLFWEWAARPLNLWHAENVRMVMGTAIYPIIPEILLTLSALWMYRLTRERSIFSRLFGGLSVPVFYTGALFISLVLTG